MAHSNDVIMVSGTLILVCALKYLFPAKCILNITIIMVVFAVYTSPIIILVVMIIHIMVVFAVYTSPIIISVVMIIMY